MQKFGIDISKWQGDFDIAKAKSEENIEFAIIKCGGADDSLYIDSQFKNNYTKCKQNGVPLGCYFFGEAKTIEEAKEEACYFAKIIEGCSFELPVFYDVEGVMLTLDKTLLTSIVKTVCDIMISKGFKAGIYTSVFAFNRYLDDSQLTQYYHWVASWNDVPPILESGHMVDIWQYGGETNYIRSNKINGQVVDQDYCYLELTSLTTPTENKKTELEIVNEIYDEKWGSGNERKVKLTSAGYDYNKIQSMVNDYTIKADEVISGKYGCDPIRTQKLTAEGYDAKTVQHIVNLKMKG